MAFKENNPGYPCRCRDCDCCEWVWPFYATSHEYPEQNSCHWTSRNCIDGYHVSHNLSIGIPLWRDAYIGGAQDGTFTYYYAQQRIYIGYDEDTDSGAYLEYWWQRNMTWTGLYYAYTATDWHIGLYLPDGTLIDEMETHNAPMVLSWNSSTRRLVATVSSWPSSDISMPLSVESFEHTFAVGDLPGSQIGYGIGLEGSGVYPYDERDVFYQERFLCQMDPRDAFVVARSANGGACKQGTDVQSATGVMSGIAAGTNGTALNLNGDRTFTLRRTIGRTLAGGSLGAFPTNWASPASSLWSDEVSGQCFDVNFFPPDQYRNYKYYIVIHTVPGVGSKDCTQQSVADPTVAAIYASVVGYCDEPNPIHRYGYEIAKCRVEFDADCGYIDVRSALDGLVFDNWETAGLGICANFDDASLEITL